MKKKNGNNKKKYIINKQRVSSKWSKIREKRAFGARIVWLQRDRKT